MRYIRIQVAAALSLSRGTSGGGDTLGQMQQSEWKREAEVSGRYDTLVPGGVVGDGSLPARELHRWVVHKSEERPVDKLPTGGKQRLSVACVQILRSGKTLHSPVLQARVSEWLIHECHHTGLLELDLSHTAKFPGASIATYKGVFGSLTRLKLADCLQQRVPNPGRAP